MIASELSKTKVFHTSLCIIPPQKLWPDIQEIRKKHDSAFIRWMPHINLMFPFVPPEEFSLAKEKLQEKLKDFKEFEIKFNNLSYFKHAKKCTLFIDPETEKGKFDEFYLKLLEAIPFCDELNKKSENGFKPHLSLGQFDFKVVEKYQEEFEKVISGKSFICEEISIIQRDGKEAPFYVKETVKLKK